MSLLMWTYLTRLGNRWLECRKLLLWLDPGKYPNVRLTRGQLNLPLSSWRMWDFIYRSIMWYLYGRLSLWGVKMVLSSTLHSSGAGNPSQVSYSFMLILNQNIMLIFSLFDILILFSIKYNFATVCSFISIHYFTFSTLLTVHFPFEV